MISHFLAVVLAAAIGTTARTPVKPSLGEVFFRFDSSALPANATDRLQRAASYASTHPSARIVLDAHCDPIGTAPYNVGLAIRRAESVRLQLRGMGVPDAQIITAVYGEDGAKRTTYAEDRRVTVWAANTPVSDVIAKTFAGHGTAVTWSKPMTTAEIEAAPSPVAVR
jgi:outer membrane protein OmpA-like peptidoglycan-associated protein